MKEPTWREPEVSRRGPDERSELETQDGDAKATVTIKTSVRVPERSVRWNVGVGLAEHPPRHRRRVRCPAA